MISAIKLNEMKTHAWEQIQSGQLEKAHKTCQDLCKANKHDPQCWYLLALTLGQLNNYTDAVKFFTKTLKISPNFMEANFHLALTHQLAGNFSAAIKYFQKTIKLNSSFPEAHFGLGSCLCRVEKYNPAAESLRTALHYKPDYLNAKINLGFVLQKLDDIDTAEALLISASKQEGSHLAYLHLGTLYQSRNDHQKALESFTKCLEIEPNSAVTWTHLGKLYRAGGKLDLAKSACAKATQLDESLIDPLCELGLIHFQSGYLHKSQKYFEKALRIDNQHIDSLIGIGSVKVSQGSYDEGLEYTRRALRIDGTNVNALILTSKTYEQLGELDEALATIQPLINEKIINAAAGAVYANICLSKNTPEDGITYLELVLQHNLPSEWEKRQLHFSLGKLYDSCKRYDEAFSHYKVANDLKSCNYSHDSQTSDTNRIISAFPRNNFKKLSRSNHKTVKPIFIVGMPRSGTSLVEQILSRHTQITAGGELTHMHDIAAFMQKEGLYGLPFPDCVNEMSTADMNKLAEEYLGKTGDLHTDKTLLTDKLPENYRLLGLINLIFPSAVIIHCSRNPIDTCLSCYFQDFLGDLNYTYNLENLVHYYKEYERLMAHWETALEIPIHNVNYEQLVADQETISKEIIEFCGLKWDQQCLEFTRTDRFVRTASYDQVRRPIYSSSIERWKNYTQHIGPLSTLIETK